MPTPFDGFGFVDAQQTVSAANMGGAIVGLAVAPIVGGGVADSSFRGTRDFGSSVALIHAMLDGDMWAGGIGWIGPRPQPTETGYTETMQILMQGFVSTNTLADARDRHVGGVLGNEPDWGLSVRRALKKDDKPTAEEQKLIDEAEAFLTEWWDGRKVHTLLIDATATLLAGKRSPLRLYVPRGKLQAQNINDDVTGRTRTVKILPVADDDIAGALAAIWPEHPNPDKATVAEDPDTKESIGVVLYNVGRTVKSTSAGEEVAEITYLIDRKDADGKPLTIIRQTGSSGRGNAGVARAVTPGATPAAAPPPPADRGAALLRLGGRLPVFEMTRSRFITAQMVQLQRALNLSMTALPRNVITAGWLERIISNAQMPGKWVNDPESRTGKRWVPDKHITGAGVTTYLKGIRNTDVGEGTTSYATPSVTFRPPAPVEPTVEAQEALYRAILREAKQEHVLVAQATAASDKSREQARADFEMTLRPTAAAVNAAGRWLIETALAMAEEFANVPGKYTGKLRATFECHIDTGPITSDERAAIDGSVKAGTLSVESAMTLERVADPAAEMARINAQPGAQLSIAERQLTAVGTAASQGLDIEGAARAVGMTAADAAALVPQFDPAATDPAAGDPGTDPGGDPANPPPGNPPAKRGPRTVTDPAPSPKPDSGGAG